MLRRWFTAIGSLAILTMATVPAVNAADAAPATAEPLTLGDSRLLEGIPGSGPLKMAEIEAWLADSTNHEPIEFVLPEGLRAAEANIFIPENSPLTRARIELGRQLFFEPRLSADFSVSCATCHNPEEGYSAQTQFGVGIGGQEGGRNSPVAYNRIVSREQFWDGRAASLEDQAIGPIANPIEMGNTHDACVACLSEIPEYKVQFERIFEDGLTIENVGKALASFERVIVTGPTPYDAYQPLARFEQLFADDLEDLEALREEDPEFVKEYEELKAKAAANPMSESAVRGMKLFFAKANCANCHAGANFTDEQYHNLGVGMEAEKPDLGRYEIVKEEAMRGAFKTPTLRNIHTSAPYMHDGSQKTLEEVMEWYDKGGHPNPWLSDKMKPLKLTEQEKADVVAFMKEGLAGEFPKVESRRLPK